jgi:hypothetical protein
MFKLEIIVCFSVSCFSSVPVEFSELHMLISSLHIKYIFSFSVRCLDLCENFSKIIAQFKFVLFNSSNE